MGAAGDVRTGSPDDRDAPVQPELDAGTFGAERIGTDETDEAAPDDRSPHEPDLGAEDLLGGEGQPPTCQLDLAAHRQVHGVVQGNAVGQRRAQEPLRRWRRWPSVPAPNRGDRARPRARATPT